MAEYYTPGVYVEEISTFPATVVRVATAVPVFIGYTELAGSDVLNIPVKVRSLIEYEALYGGEPTTDGRSITVHLDSNWRPASVDLSLTYYLYQSLRQFYANGGGDAYILSVGPYSPGGPDKTELIAALAELEKADEPTLVMVPDAFAFTDPQDLGDVQAQVLMHCAKMQDRFGLFDVLHGSGNDEAADALAFRNKVGNNNLSYGAAYYPEVLSSLGPVGEITSGEIGLLDSNDAPTTFADVAVGAGEVTGIFPNYTGTTGLLEHGQAMNDVLMLKTLQENYGLAWEAALNAALTGDETVILGRITVLRDLGAAIFNLALTHGPLNLFFEANVKSNAGTLKPLILLLYEYYKALYDAGSHTFLPPTAPVAPLMDQGDFVALPVDYGLDLFTDPLPGPNNVYGAASPDLNTGTTTSAVAFGLLFDAMIDVVESIIMQGESLLAASEADLPLESGAYAGILAAIRNTGYTLSPTAAVAGVYAVTDANRGVWKAPANVSLNAVVDVVRKFQATELDDLNMPTNGKAINAIRPFRGQGILVYGARTLAGNDNEWRFVSVRRLFLMVEESVRKACEPLVFEPNDANLWQRVRGMIENFLTGIWRDGGLAGATTKDAFFVKAGIGSTMTAEDILEGKLIVEIGMAAVRPAEFVILKFMHKMQVS